jgi:cell division protein FtsZ
MVFDFNQITSENAEIKVVGVGGGGMSAVGRMMETKLTGVEFVVANTDAIALKLSKAKVKIQLGSKIARGLGAGANWEIGKKAAEESRDDIKSALEGADMVFITAAMGGGTGTGAAAIVAEVAREIKALTIAVVTKPFFFEGAKRASAAEIGIKNIKEQVDALICIPNDKLLETSGENISYTKAFGDADEILKQGVQGISDIIVLSDNINTDFADVKKILTQSGSALMGVGSASGHDKAITALQTAIGSPLVEDSIEGSTKILINILSGKDLRMQEVNKVMSAIHDLADEEAEIILGQIYNDEMQDEVKITVIAAGFNKQEQNEFHLKRQALNNLAIVKPKTESENFTPTRDIKEIPAFLRKKNRP